jgi:hypothetical protein
MSEKEFLTRELKRHETQKQNFNSKDRKIMLNEVETQTKSDIEKTLSIMNYIVVASVFGSHIFLKTS